MYRFPAGFLLETYSQASQTLASERAAIQLRSVRKTFKNRETYTLNKYVLFIPLLGKKIFYAQQLAYPVEAGELLFIRQGAPISCDLVRLDQDRFEAIMFYMEPEFISEVLQKYQIKLASDAKQTQDLCVTQAVPLVVSCIESLLVLAVSPGAQSEALIRLKMEELLLTLLQTPSEEATLLTQLLAGASRSDILPYLELIEICLTEPLSVEQMAQRVCLSPSAFKKEFKRLFAATPAQFMLEKRLLRAQQMLTNSEQSITEIGLANGFESTSHFIKRFKTRFGQTPGQIRKN